MVEPVRVLPSGCGVGSAYSPHTKRRHPRQPIEHRPAKLVLLLLAVSTCCILSWTISVSPARRTRCSLSLRRSASCALTLSRAALQDKQVKRGSRVVWGFADAKKDSRAAAVAAARGGVHRESIPLLDKIRPGSTGHVRFLANCVVRTTWVLQSCDRAPQASTPPPPPHQGD